MTIAQSSKRSLRKPLRLWPGVVAVVLQWLARFGVNAVVPGSGASARDAVGIRRRAGCRRVVGVLQPGALVRAPGRHRPDGRRAGRDMASPHESMGPGCGFFALRHPGPVPRPRRRGGGQPSPLRRTSARVDGRGHPARVRSVDALPDRRHQRRPVAEFDWRWTKTPEERLLAQAGDEPARLRSARADGSPPAPAAGGPGGSRRTPAASRRLRAAASPAGPTSTGEPACHSGSSGTRSRVARLSRTRARRHRSRRADRDRLVRIAAGRAVAPADRTGLVILRGPRRPSLHPGAAR